MRFWSAINHGLSSLTSRVIASSPCIFWLSPPAWPRRDLRTSVGDVDLDARRLAIRQTLVDVDDEPNSRSRRQRRAGLGSRSCDRCGAAGPPRRPTRRAHGVGADVRRLGPAVPVGTALELESRLWWVADVTCPGRVVSAIPGLLFGAATNWPWPEADTADWWVAGAGPMGVC